MTARSVGVSLPTTVALYSVPSESLTIIAMLFFSMTWAFVMMYPSSVMIIPEPCEYAPNTVSSMYTSIVTTESEHAFATPSTVYLPSG